MQREVVAELGGQDARLGLVGSATTAPLAGSDGAPLWSSSLSDDAAALLERFDSRSIQLRSLLLDDLFGSETEDGNDDDEQDLTALRVVTSVPEPLSQPPLQAAQQAQQADTPPVSTSQAPPSMTPETVAVVAASSPSRDARVSRPRSALPPRVARDLRSQYPPSSSTTPSSASASATPSGTPSTTSSTASSTASSSAASSPSADADQAPGLIPTPLSLPTTSHHQHHHLPPRAARKQSSPPLIALDSPPTEPEWGAPPPPRMVVASSPLANGNSRRAVMTPKPNRDRGLLLQLQQSPGKHDGDDLRHHNTIADYFPSRSPTDAGQGLSGASDSGSPEPPFFPAPLPPPPVLHAHARSYNPSPRHPPLQRFTTPPLRSLSLASTQTSLMPRISPYRQAESPLMLPEARPGVRPGLLQVPVARSSSVPPVRARGLSDEAAVAQFAAQAQAVIDHTLQQARAQLDEVMSGYVTMYAHQLQRDRQRSPHSNVI